MNLRLAALQTWGSLWLLCACDGGPQREIEGGVGQLSQALSPTVATQLAYPELDLNVPVGYIWSHDASAANIDAARSQGFRLHSIEVLSGSPLRFTAALVHNSGVYARTGNDWAYDLTEAQLLAIYADKSRRIMDFARYLVAGDERFAAVWLDNTGSQYRDYRLLMNIDEFSLQFEAAGYRVMATEPAQTPPCGVLGCGVSALMIPNTGVDAREQWFEAATGEELEDRISTEDIFCDGTTRACRRLTDVYEAPDGFLFAVTEEAFAHELPIYSSQTPASHYYIRLDEGEKIFWAANLEYMPGDLDNPDSLEHWQARTGGRFARLVPYPAAGETRYFATAVANAGMPVTDPFPTSNFVIDMIDDWITTQMRRGQIPGMSLAIARGGKLVYAKGFGYSDIGNLRQANPTDLFRVASVSKMLAKAAVIRMQQDGLQVPLSNASFDIDLHPFGEIWPYTEPGHAPNLGDVTVRDLLNHKPGVAYEHFGPLFRPQQGLRKSKRRVQLPSITAQKATPDRAATRRRKFTRMRTTT